MTEKERIESIRFFLKKNKTEFAKVLGYTTPQSYTSYLSGKSSASIKMIKSLIEYDNRFNINWILFGQGQMLIGGQSNNTQSIKNRDGTISNVSNNGNNTTVVEASDSIELLQTKVEHLTKEVGHLNKMLEDKEEIIRLLKR